MDISSVLTIGAISSVVVVGLGVAFQYYKKRNLEKFFNQMHELSSQVPKQKKNSFQLLMIKETLAAAGKKNKSSFGAKLQNPKYLEVQLMQMSKVLKDPSNVQDKVMKQSLNLLKEFQKWEKEKIAKAQEQKVVQDKQAKVS